jgi:hypothetical protein
MGERQLKIVRLIEPEMCLACRFAQRATTQNEFGEVQHLVHCTRLDCDNWDTQTFEPAQDVVFDEERPH